jgi:RHS repeat-associated protein
LERRIVFRKANLSGAVLAFVFVANVVFAQVPTGTPPYSSLGGGPFDVVNLGNLNVHFAIPILNKAGRGQTFTYNLSYDNSVWYPVTTGGTTTWTPVTNWGWKGQTEVATGYLAYKLSTSTTMGCTTSTYTYAYHDSFGATHVFPGAATYRFSPTHTCSTSFSGFTNTAVDNSGYQLSVTSFSNLAGTLTTRGGKVIAAPLNLTTGPASATDANGNEITVNTSGQFFDTHSATTAALTVSGTAPSPTTFVYPETSGNATYTMKYSSTAVNIKTNFGCSGVGEYTATGVYLVSSIVLPDGSQYGFTYEQTPGYSTDTTARISKVTLPTGGTITYDYTGSNDGTNCADGSALNLTRTLSPGGAWTYARSNVSGKHWQTTVTTPPDPDNSNVANEMVIQFQQDSATPASANTNNFYETERQVYEGTSTSGTILATTFTCYNGNSIGTPASCPTTAVASPFSEITAFRYLPDASGSESETDLLFDTANGLVANEYDYNYGTGMVGGLLRHVSTAYNTTLGNGITDHPASVKVYSSSGLVAQTTYTYDETAVTASGATQLVSISGSRGNLTTVASQASSTTTLYRKFTYFDTGMVNQAGDLSTTNAMVNPSTYTYYSSGNCVNAYSFPSTIAEPLSLSRSATWDCNGGVPLSVTDENSNATTYAYDSMWRNTDIKYPDGGETQSSFYIDNVPSYTRVQKLVTTGVWDEAQTNLDGFGRPDKTANLSDPNGYDYQDITYDSLGRLASVSSPYYTTGDPTYGVTDYSYDALGRTTTITNPDSTSKTFAYAGSATKSTDESGIEKVMQTDGLGRLAYVCDGVGAGTQANGASASACSLPFSPSGFLSTYVYDPLGNLTSATVGAHTGFSGQTRSFAYDELSRMTSETNPESGTITKAYDTGSAGDLYTSTAPKPNSTTSGTVTTTYAWDALHRIANITFSDGAVGYYYTYDVATDGGHTLSNTKGRLVEPEHGTGSTTIGASILSYDKMGRIAQEWACQPSNCGAAMTSLAYTYNLLGEPITATSDNGGYYFTYNYNAIGQLTGIVPSTHDSTHPDSEYSGATYNALGELTAGTYGDGTTVAKTYNHMGRLTQITDSVYSLALAYAPNGSVTTYNDSKAGNWTLTYDAFNRLATGSNATTGAAYSYTYDQFGNRWQQHLTAGTGNEVDYTFNANNQNITSGFQYDIAGNLLKDGSGCNPCWTYDDTSNLVSDSGGASFSYNGLNRRVEKITPDGTKHDFLLDPSGKPFNEYENGNTAFSRVTGGVFTYANGVAYYNHTDHLGTPRVTTDYTGTVQRVETNLPWGDNFAETGSFIDFTGFADGDWDSETNADHFEAREYAKPQGRWLTPDPSGLAAVDPSDPQTWNRYAYASNNPLTFSDRSGLDDDACDIIFCGDDGGGGGGGADDGGGGEGGNVGGPVDGDNGGTPCPNGPPCTVPGTTTTVTAPGTWVPGGISGLICNFLGLCGGSETDGADGATGGGGGVGGSGAQTSCSNGYRDATPDERNAILQQARGQVGVPYASGAGKNSDPSSGFDCSGLVSFCINASGIPFVYSATGTLASSFSVRPISSGQMSPGDLLLFSGHVGFYDPGQSTAGPLLSATSSKGVRYTPTSFFGGYSVLRVRVKCK